MPRLTTAIALLAILAFPVACGGRDGADDGELAPGTFTKLAPERAAEALHSALLRGVLKYRSTADVAAWLRARPNAWQSDYRANPIRAYNSELRGLAPEAQAWLLVAVHWVVPELANPQAAGVDSGAEPDPRKGERPILPFSRLNFRGLPAADFPAAAAVIAERVRSNLVSEQKRSLPEAFSLDDPSAEFKLLVAVGRGEPALATDAIKVTSALESRGTWSPARQIALGIDLLRAAKDARDESTRSALVRTATDAIIEGTSGYYRARPRLMSVYGPVQSLYPTFTSEDKPIIRDIEARFFERASHEDCPNFGENVLPVDRKALSALWTDRFAKGADALCLWFPPHWVPVDEIVTRYPEVALQLVTHPTRPGDGLRREILIKRLMPYVFADGDGSGSSDGEPIGLDSNPELGRAIREEVKPPSFRLGMDVNGLAIVRFRDPEFKRAWQSRPTSRQTRSSGGDDLAGLSALLGAAEKDIRSLIEQEFIPRGCRVSSLNAEVWGSPKDRWRLAWLGCFGERQSPATPLPLQSAAWPRNASDTDAFSWLVWDYQPLILVDTQGARVVWLPDRVLGGGAQEDKRIVGITDLDGNIVIVVQGTDGPCRKTGCGREDLRIEISELTQNVFSFLRRSANAK